MTATTLRPVQVVVASSPAGWWLWLALPTVPLVAAGVANAALILWAVPVIWAAVFDARRSRLPDRLVLPGVGLTVLATLTASAIEGTWRPFIVTSAGAAVMAAPLAAMHVVSPAGLGFGDVKYGVLLGAGIGLVGAPGAGLLVLVVAGFLQLVVARARPWPAQRHPDAVRGAAPFGPSLAIASIGWVVMVLVMGGL